MTERRTSNASSNISRRRNIGDFFFPLKEKTVSCGVDANSVSVAGDPAIAECVCEPKRRKMGKEYLGVGGLVDIFG